jgi:hypothetical protein
MSCSDKGTLPIGTPAVVDVAGRDLRIRCADGRTRRAVPVGGGRFRFSEQTHPSMMFTAAADGTPVFSGKSGVTSLRYCAESSISITRETVKCRTATAMSHSSGWFLRKFGPTTAQGSERLLAQHKDLLRFLCPDHRCPSFLCHLYAAANDNSIAISHWRLLG